MKQLEKCLKNRQGTTLVEMLVTLTLITIMVGMAATTLSAAFKIFLRVQKEQYAQSVLDTTMTELRSLTKEATQYVKIYANDASPEGQGGADSGPVLEYVNTDGYAVLVSTGGCEATNLYQGETLMDQADAVSQGRLLTRFYLRDQDTYVYSRDGSPAARAVATVFADKYYMGNYLGVTFSYWKGEQNGDQVHSVKAEVTLYSDAERTNVVAKESEILDLRYKAVRNDEATASSQSAGG